ncbi:MAG TPA: hypothetical protein VGB38_07045 [bacterium]
MSMSITLQDSHLSFARKVGGDLPADVLSARDLVQVICRKDERAFRT